MPLVIHTTLEDADIKNAVKEAYEGEIVSATREALEKIIGETVADKVRSVFSDSRVETTVERIIRNEVKSAVASTLSQIGWSGAPNGKLHPQVEKAVREEVRSILRESLARITS